MTVDVQVLCKSAEVTVTSSAPALRSKFKRCIDLIIAAIVVVVTLPITVTIYFIVKFDGGPGFFLHKRIGAGGKSFNCIKFRTMVTDGKKALDEAFAKDPVLEAEWRNAQKLRYDPRVTPIGRFLRALSLDEIPQLLNVLRNEMSLVGPRPITAAELERYGDNITHYYAVRPGLTGMWQVNGRSRTTYQRRVELDVHYAKQWSHTLDLSILLKTIPVVLQRDGAH